MISEIDRNTLRALVEREGIVAVYRTLCDVLGEMGVPGEHPAHTRRAETITNVRTGQSFPVTVHEAAGEEPRPRIVSASAPKRARRAQPQITSRIVTAAAPKRPKKEDE